MKTGRQDRTVGTGTGQGQDEGRKVDRTDYCMNTQVTEDGQHQ